MDILAKNTATTEKYSEILESSLSRWNVLRVEVRDKIAETAATYARLMLEAEDDIGNPDELCNQLSKLRLKYTEIKIQEGEEQAKIMQSYFNETNENMMNMMCVSLTDKTNSVFMRNISRHRSSIGLAWRHRENRGPKWVGQECRSGL